jgi:GntR family transcriptional regulator, transcriptional repressor for pyruvate dehydrogenase complex
MEAKLEERLGASGHGKTKIYEEVAKHIRRMITDGKLRAGDRLPSERNLARDLGISRSSVREALKLIESSGSVKSLPTRGLFYTPPPPDSTGPVPAPLALAHDLISQEELAIQLVETLKLLAPGMARLAAERATEQDLAELTAAIRQGQEEATDGQSEWAARGVCSLIAAATKNQVLMNMVDTIERLSHCRHGSALRAVDSEPSTWQSYEAIVAAIGAHDAQAASLAMLKHLLSAEAQLRRSREVPRARASSLRSDPSRF